MAKGRFPEVAAYVRAAIAGAGDLPAFQGLLIGLMSRPGRILSTGSPAKWPAFVLNTCEVLGGDRAPAIVAASAVEFIVAAADVVDDVVDDEWDEGIAARSRALNATLALTLLSHQCASRLAESLGVDRARLVGSLITNHGLAACVGEDLDLVFETCSEVGEEQAHEMTRRKAGSIVAMACQIGAAVATEDQNVLRLVGDFGAHVGVIAQLLNDIAGVAKVGSDLRRRKKTVPIAYALKCASEEGLDSLDTLREAPTALDRREEERLAALMRDLGALHYAWLVADVHRREALAILPVMEELTGREDIRQLRRLLPRMRTHLTWREGLS